MALADAVNWLIKNGSLEKSPLKGQVAALSVGIYEGVPVADFDYDEDHLSDTDMNVVMTDAGKFVELQGTAEDRQGEVHHGDRAGGRNLDGQKKAG